MLPTRAKPAPAAKVPAPDAPAQPKPAREGHAMPAAPSFDDGIDMFDAAPLALEAA